jgi:hypothetical protein
MAEMITIQKRFSSIMGEFLAAEHEFAGADAAKPK